MKFSEIANRLARLSTPLRGVSRQSPDLEVSAARLVIAFLEDRLVLYAREEMEVAFHCVHSVLESRAFLAASWANWTLKTGWRKSYSPGLIPIPTMTNAILRVRPSGSELLRQSQKRAACGVGWRVDTSSPVGNCRATFGSSLVTTENKAVVGGRKLMGSAGTL
jgi:hypothetical protein